MLLLDYGIILHLFGTPLQKGSLPTGQAGQSGSRRRNKTTVSCQKLLKVKKPLFQNQFAGLQIRPTFGKLPFFAYIYPLENKLMI